MNGVNIENTNIVSEIIDSIIDKVVCDTDDNKSVIELTNINVNINKDDKDDKDDDESITFDTKSEQDIIESFDSLDMKLDGCIDDFIEIEQKQSSRKYKNKKTKNVTVLDNETNISTTTLDNGVYLEMPTDSKKYKFGINTNSTNKIRYMPTTGSYRISTCRWKNIKLAIVVTMYAETPEELNRSLEGIARNIMEFIRKNNKNHKDGLSWKDICVVIVSDGSTKILRNTLKYLSEIGIYNKNLWKHAKKNGHITDKTTCHIFEYAAQIFISDINLVRSLGKRRWPPMQTIFALKVNNAGKLDSHKWFFDAFCSKMKPYYVALIDAGTKPEPTAIVSLISSMNSNTNIGGCCGEICVDKPRMWLMNPIVAAQVFEYKISHIMEKAMESWFGFITVLPGAFSAYRYKALVGNNESPGIVNDENYGSDYSIGVGHIDKFDTPLYKYFKSLPDPNEVGALSVASRQGAFDANMYLAEDRILCFEICAMENKSYTLHWNKNARAHTDIPENLATLLKQRRRWLNGSFFAGLFSLIHFWKLMKTKHSLLRKIGFFVQFIYMLTNTLVTWFLLSALTVAATVQIFSVEMDDIIIMDTTIMYGKYMHNVFAGLYLLNIIAVFFVSLRKVNPVKYSYIYKFIGFIFTVLLVCSIIAGYYALSIKENIKMIVVISLLLIPGAIIFTGILHGELFTILSSGIHYLFMLPTYIHIFTIYSFCNIDDVSWGTKGIDKAVAPKIRDEDDNDNDNVDEDEEYQLGQVIEDSRFVKETRARNKSEFKAYRSKVVFVYVLTNLIIGFVMMYSLDLLSLPKILPNVTDKINRNYVMVFIAVVVFLIAYRIIGSILYQIERLIKATICKKYVKKTESNSMRNIYSDQLEV
jgi:chitin synthase